MYNNQALALTALLSGCAGVPAKPDMSEKPTTLEIKKTSTETTSLPDDIVIEESTETDNPEVRVVIKRVLNLCREANKIILEDQSALLDEICKSTNTDEDLCKSRTPEEIAVCADNEDVLSCVSNVSHSPKSKPTPKESLEIENCAEKIDEESIIRQKLDKLSSQVVVASLNKRLKKLNDSTNATINQFDSNIETIRQDIDWLLNQTRPTSEDWVEDDFSVFPDEDDELN